MKLIWSLCEEFPIIFEWTRPSAGGILRRMILLSEVADKIRNEILTWPSHRNVKVRILIDPSLNDARKGDEGIFNEVLMMSAGLLPGTVSGLDIKISGNDEEIGISFKFDDKGTSTLSLPYWNDLADKATGWNPRISSDENGVILTLALPAADAYPPVNLRSMARETGIRTDEARSILKGFIINARSHLEILQDRTDNYGEEERFRAAHSLKGAGKTLRAPELASAARALERNIREKTGTTGELKNLESVWNRIERWFEGDST